MKNKGEDEPLPPWTWGDVKKALAMGWCVSRAKPRCILPCKADILIANRIELPHNEKTIKRVQRLAELGDNTAIRALRFITLERLTT